MSDIVKWMQSINDGSALTDSLREVRELKAEVERLKGALREIAVKAGTSECGGNYVAAISLIGDIEQMADKALEAKP